MADYFVNRYARLTGDDPEDIVCSVDSRSLRVNSLKSSDEELLSRLRARGVRLSEIGFLQHAYRFEADFSLGATEEYLLGLYYLQEAASQLPVLVLEHALARCGVRLDEASVLDMCAAPGSKTTQLAAAMDNRGSVVALDADRRRVEALANNLERCGVSNTHAFHKDALFADDLGLQFDAVLLDAPCSGNFCSERGWLDKRRMGDPKQMASVQRELLEVAFRVLKPGGVLVYSTCSLEVEEDEMVVDHVPVEVASLVETGLSVGSPAASSFDGVEFREDVSLARRLWPHRDGTQGFFVAAFVKHR